MSMFDIPPEGWDPDDDPAGPAMTPEEAQAVINSEFMDDGMKAMMKDPRFKQEMGLVLETFRSMREEFGDGTEGAKQRMNNLELLFETAINS